MGLLLGQHAASADGRKGGGGRSRKIAQGWGSVGKDAPKKGVGERGAGGGGVGGGLNHYLTSAHTPRLVQTAPERWHGLWTPSEGSQ